MNTSEVREVLRREFYSWIVTEPPAPNSAKRESYEAVDAALAALKDVGIDIQELQAKAAAYNDLERWLTAKLDEQESIAVWTDRVEGLMDGYAIAGRKATQFLDKHRARLIPGEGEKK